MAATTRVRGMLADQILVTFLNSVSDAFPGGASVSIDGVVYDKAALEQKLQELLAPFKAADDLRAQASNAVKARNAAEPAVQPFIDGLVKGLRYVFSTDANLLARLGLPAAKATRKLTAEEKVARKTKAAATRKLRNTMGPRQKEAVKAQGEVQVAATLASTPGTLNGTPSNGELLASPTMDSVEFHSR